MLNKILIHLQHSFFINYLFIDVKKKGRVSHLPDSHL